MAYGLGKAGWVSIEIGDGEPVPVDMLKAWIDESYRAQAPKKLVRMLDGATRGAEPPGGKPKGKPKQKARRTR